MAFSTPKQKPKCLAVWIFIGPKSSKVGEKSVLLSFACFRMDFISEIIEDLYLSGISNVLITPYKFACFKGLEAYFLPFFQATVKSQKQTEMFNYFEK